MTSAEVTSSNSSDGGLSVMVLVAEWANQDVQGERGRIDGSVLSKVRVIG